MEITGEMLLEACNKARPFISRLLGKQASELEDVLQTACMKALKHSGSFDGRSLFSTWFCTIARNEALMFLRACKKKPLCELPISLQLNSLSPERIALLKARNQDLRDCIMLLTPSCRLETLTWSAGLEYPCDANTRKARRHRAKRELRVMMGVE